MRLELIRKGLYGPLLTAPPIRLCSAPCPPPPESDSAVGKSQVESRRRERPIKRLRPRADRELQRVCDDLQVDPPVDERRDLMDEVIRFADPYAFKGIDAVIPAERPDLMRLWFLYRLAHIVETPAEVQRAVRRIAPSPDDDFRPGERRLGDPGSAEVAAAYASRQRRRARQQEVTVTNENS